MFKYFLVILIFWCQVQEYVSDQNKEQSDTTKLLTFRSQNDSLVSNERKTAEEINRKPAITMNGHNNYHVEVGQQIFYIYGEQQVKRLISAITSDDKSDVANDITNNNSNNSSVEKLPQDYSVTHGIGAHKLYFNNMTWNKARQTCIQEGGHLAIINSELEEQVLLQKLNENNVDYAWLGLHDLFEEGYWITVNDEPLESTGYAKWTTAFPTTEPNNYDGKQHCAALTRWGGMDDYYCTELRFFFCEISV